MSHPIRAAVAAVDEVLVSVAECNPVFLSRGEKAAVLRELARVEARLAGLRLRVIAVAGEVAEGTGARDVAEWLTVHTHARFEEARADQWLAEAIDRRYGVLGAALGAGEVTPGQARVIARALDDLPAGVPAETLTLAETTLVGHCDRFGPRSLARLGRRILEVVAPEIADAAEARRLAALEAQAHRRTRLTMRRVGDGTTRLSGLLPDATATRLATYLEAFTNPRRNGRQPDHASPDHASPDRLWDPVARPGYPRRLGQAFCQLLETLDPLRLPLHGGDATTVVVTLDYDTLRRDLDTGLGTADLLGSDLPGPEGHGDQITAAHARRLACTAAIIPAVLGGDSQVLDLGRARRLFNHPQRRAMAVRDRECLTEGCTIPAPWCEAHHWHPWAHGGHTNIGDGGLLCAHHHHKAHDPTYHIEHLPTGRIRFHRRT